MEKLNLHSEDRLIVLFWDQEMIGNPLRNAE
jgi:hypothetical protein